MNPPCDVDITDEDAPTPEERLVTPELFLGWSQRFCKILTADNKCVRSYDDLEAGGLYALQRPGDFFSGYMKVEAEIQAHDAVSSIVRGEVDGLEAFQNGKVTYEYDIVPPNDVEPPGRFRFPVRPDAVVMNNGKWLLLEAKHNLTQKDVTVFNQKVKFIEQNLTQRWVRKNNDTPKGVVGALCSVSKPDPSLLKAAPRLFCLVRQGMRFVRL